MQQYPDLEARHGRDCMQAPMSSALRVRDIAQRRVKAGMAVAIKNTEGAIVCAFDQPSFCIRDNTDGIVTRRPDDFYVCAAQCIGLPQPIKIVRLCLLALAHN